MENSKVKSLTKYGIKVTSPDEQPLAVAATSSPPKPRLLNQVRQAIRAREYSPRTEEAYVHWIKRR